MRGVRTFKQELANDPLATKRVEVAVVTFGPVMVQSDFHTVPNFHPADLEADGDTPIGAAISMGIDMVARRKKEYKGARHFVLQAMDRTDNRWRAY